MIKKIDCRNEFSSKVMELANIDDRIVVVCNDSISSSGMTEFDVRFPNRMFNVGIAEQNMIGVAAGLANAGLIPVVCSASAFLCARAFEQIKVDVGYSNANVKLFGVSPGFAYGALGATHHSPEDVALIQAIPNIFIAVPGDPAETRSATEAAIKHQGPTFVRILRTPVSSFSQESIRFEFGKSHKLRAGSDVLFIANGLMVQETIGAIDILEKQNVSCGLINASSVRPIDEIILFKEAANYRFIVTVEEGNSCGGMGSRVAQIILGKNSKPIMNLGVSDFAPTGSTEQILKHFGLTSEGIANSTIKLINVSNESSFMHTFSYPL
ncbi:transketolase family protein [Nitrincola sp. MINF-07-Sa-05]|uniref:transketolase family protein n=1 Tax=Nitrincola salilacus TaxID=3400273 RepID=UPI0039181AE4